MSSGGRIGRWLWPITTLVVGAAGIGAGLMLGGAAPTPEVQATQEPVTTQVQARRLTKTVAFDCAVVRESTAVPAPSVAQGAALVVTGRRTQGTTVREGAVVMEVSGRPVIALVGPFPLFRVLKEGDEGKDVAMLQRALNRVRPDIEVTGTFDEDTATSVRRLYRKLGYEPPVVGGGSDAVSVQPGEFLILPASPATLAKAIPAVGSRVGTELLTYFSGFPFASCTADRLADVPVGAAVEFPDAGLKGFYSGPDSSEAVSSAASAQSASKSEDANGAASAAIRAAGHVTLTGGSAPAPGAVLKGMAAIEATKGPVLTVPLSAVQGGRDSASVVVVRQGAHATVPVKLGVIADGFVQITPVSTDSLRAGDAVLVGHG